MEGYIQKLSDGKTKRYVQYLEIINDPELISMYRKWHSEEYHWKEIRDGIRDVGLAHGADHAVDGEYGFCHSASPLICSISSGRDASRAQTSSSQSRRAGKASRSFSSAAV